MKWYWWLVIVILGLNALVIVLISIVLFIDWIKQKRIMRKKRQMMAGDSERT